ncbi:hypothetical protein ABPG74_000790 [Tetrahymena malaccensis]
MKNFNQVDPSLQRELVEYLQDQEIYQQKLAALNFKPSSYSFAKKISEYKDEDAINYKQNNLATIMMFEKNRPDIINDLEKMGYQSISLISAGIQTFVVRALNTQNQLRSVIKCVRTKYNQLSNQEVENQIKQEEEYFKKCSQSSNIVKLIPTDHTKQGGQFAYLVFQECQKTLQHLMADNKDKFSEIAVIKYSMNIAQGLYDAQVQNCPVLDLKPENILIDQFGNALISKFVLEVQNSLESKVVIGNSPYQAPESVEFDQNQREINIEKRESFSLGMLIYRMLITGEKSFEEKLKKVFQEKKVILENELNGFRFRYLLERLVYDLTKFDPEERISVQDALCILKGIFSQYINIGLESTQVFAGDITTINDSLKESIEFTQVSGNQFSPILLKPLKEILEENKEWLDTTYVLKNSKLFQYTVEETQNEYLQAKNDLQEQIEGLNGEIKNLQDKICHMEFLSDVRNNKKDFCTFIEVEELKSKFDIGIDKYLISFNISKQAQRLYDFLEQINQKLSQIAYEKKLEQERLEKERIQKEKEEQERAQREKEEAEKLQKEEQEKIVLQKKAELEKLEENNKTTQTESSNSDNQICNCCEKNKTLVNQPQNKNSEASKINNGGKIQLFKGLSSDPKTTPSLLDFSNKLNQSQSQQLQQTTNNLSNSQQQKQSADKTLFSGSTNIFATSTQISQIQQSGLFGSSTLTTNFFDKNLTQKDQKQNLSISDFGSKAKIEQQQNNLNNFSNSLFSQNNVNQFSSLANTDGVKFGDMAQANGSDTINNSIPRNSQEQRQFINQHLSCYENNGIFLNTKELDEYLDF